MAELSEISRARTKLHTAIAEALAPLPWRVHRTSPPQIAAPTVWLDSVEVNLDEGASSAFIVATFPIFVVVDGTVRRQIEELDDMLALIWTAAALAGGEPQSSRPQSLDVGGPSLRAQVLAVDVPIQARTLCPLDLVSTGGNP